MRQLLTESLLLSIAGGALGLLLAFWVTDLMEGFIPILEYNIIKNFFAIDSRALVFTLVVSLATGLVFGLAPAWHSSNPDVVPVLKGDGEAASEGSAERLVCETSSWWRRSLCRWWCLFAVVCSSRVFVKRRRWIRVSTTLMA